jgi:hypothetical protein
MAKTQNQEKIQLKGPDLHFHQTELVPPEMNNRQEQIQHPSQMNGIDTLGFGVLDEFRDAYDQPGNTDPQHHADDDAYVDKMLWMDQLWRHGTSLQNG